MITLKEEFVDGDKWRRAIRLGGSDAIVLWLCIKAHAARHLTDGFISKEDLETLAGAPPKSARALKALLECGRLQTDGSRGAGLIEDAPNGFQLHDYLDHAESRERLLERRKLAASRKRKQRDGECVPPDVTRSVTPPVPRDTQRDVSRDRLPALADRPASVPRGRADVPTPLHSALPQPEIIAAADPKDLSGQTREPIGNGGGSSGEPKSLEESLKLPICVRADYAQRNEHLRDFLEPQRWPEVVAVAEALAQASGARAMPLAVPSRDAGVRAVLVLYAAGWVPSDVIRAARQLPREPGWSAEGKRRGLSWLSPEVARRALGAAEDFDARRERSQRARADVPPSPPASEPERVPPAEVDALVRKLGSGPGRAIPNEQPRRGPVSVEELDKAIGEVGTP